MFALLFKLLSLEQLISGVINAATKAVDTHQAQAGYLAGQASAFQRESDAHLVKANMAKNVIGVLKSLSVTDNHSFS